MKAPAVLLACLSIALPTTSLAQVREIVPNGLYPAGSRLASPLTGISFRLPDGFRAEWDPAMGGLVAVSNDGPFGGIWGWSEGTVEEITAEVGARLASQGIELQVRGEPVLTPDSMRAVFDALANGERGILHAAIRTGPQGGTLAVAGVAERGNADRAEAFVDAVVGSLEWSRPGAAVWRQEVEGTVLARSGGGSDLSTGATTATGASSSSATLAFCGPGQYRYRESSETYVSIPGASASSTSSDEHMGQWWLVADLAGSPSLILEATDGRTFQWAVEESGSGFLIDGGSFSVTGGC